MGQEKERKKWKSMFPVVWVLEDQQQHYKIRNNGITHLANSKYKHTNTELYNIQSENSNKSVGMMNVMFINS